MVNPSLSFAIRAFADSSSVSATDRIRWGECAIEIVDGKEIYRLIVNNLFIKADLVQSIQHANLKRVGPVSMEQPENDDAIRSEMRITTIMKSPPAK